MIKDFVSVVAFVVVVVCHIHGVVGKEDKEAAREEYLDAHNEARAEVGVAPLKWSGQLEQEASRWVRNQRDHQDCNDVNVNNGGKYGLNQFWEGDGRLTPRMAVESWVDEKKYYDHSTNSCAWDQMCGSYTQVVWRSSLDLGCAKAICRNSAFFTTALIICFYYPPRNYVGQSPY